MILKSGLFTQIFLVGFDYFLCHETLFHQIYHQSRTSWHHLNDTGSQQISMRLLASADHTIINIICEEYGMEEQQYWLQYKEA